VQHFFREGEEDEDREVWDFSDKPPTIAPKSQPQEHTDNKDWITNMKPVTKVRNTFVFFLLFLKKQFLTFLLLHYTLLLLFFSPSIS